MSEFVKQSVALVIWRKGQPTRLLVVRRPEAVDEELPGVWGLPAGSQRSGESLEETAFRVGSSKLGLKVNLGMKLAQGRQQRPGYELAMTLWEAEAKGQRPSLSPVDLQEPGMTYYVVWQWAEPGFVREGAQRGSLCCQLLLYLDVAR